MSSLIILGAGTGGTLLANKLRKALPSDWSITVIDRNNAHHYQPGYLFIPFGTYRPKQVVKPRDRYLPGVKFLIDEATAIDKDSNTITLASGQVIGFDKLIVATGTHSAPEEVAGMAEALANTDSVHEFYSLEGASRLKPALKKLKKGNLVVHISEMPIKCPVAPMEFALLAQDYMRKRGRGFDVDITFVTPLDGAFTKPVASQELGTFLATRGIKVVTDFHVAEVDGPGRQLTSFDGRVVDFDLLVTVPPNRGATVIADSHLGNDAGFLPVNPHTLQSLASPDIWGIGDATDVPTSKAGSVVHFQADTLVPNLLANIAGRDLPESFDGHANCFIESGRGEAMLLDFNYEQEPVTGTFPLAKVGPLKLLAPSKLNHLSKLAFEHVYWNLLIRGLPLPVSAHMSTAGKNIKTDATR